MADAQLKHLSRRELLEMLIEQSKETENLNKIIAEQNEKLSDKKIIEAAEEQGQKILGEAQARADEINKKIAEIGEINKT